MDDMEKIRRLREIDNVKPDPVKKPKRYVRKCKSCEIRRKSR